MEEVIVNGYTRLIELIKTTDAAIEQNAAAARNRDNEILGRMGIMTAPVIDTMGISILEKGKKDNTGEIYDAKHYDLRFFVLGKGAEIAPFRPDNTNKAVTDQFCLLGQDGKFYEVMYSMDDLVVDSYLGELSPREVLDIYGYEAVFMLYKGMKEYLEGQETLLANLEGTLRFLAVAL